RLSPATCSSSVNAAVHRRKALNPPTRRLRTCIWRRYPYKHANTAVLQQMPRLAPFVPMWYNMGVRYIAMTREALPIDIHTMPDLARLAKEVARDGRPRVLREDETDLAILSPARPRRRLQAKAVTPADIA